MSRVRTLLALAGGLYALVFAIGCSSPPPPAADDGPARGSDAAAAETGRVVQLDQAMLASVRTESVSPHTAPRILRATGKVQFDEGRIARILAPVAGAVTGLRVKVGDRVAKDSLLFSLDSRDAAAAIEDHLDAHRDLELAEKNLAMTKDLFEHQAASRFQLDQATSDTAKAKTRVDRTEAALVAIGIHAPEDPTKPIDPLLPVTSPIAGTVLERHVSDGQYVQPDPTPLLTVADVSEVWIEADVFERDLHLVKPGESAEVHTTAYEGESFRAQVARIGDVLDPVSRTTKVRFVVANPTGRLKPEMFATISLFVDATEQALIVPAAAVMTEGDRTFVYVQTGERTFARRNVETAPDAKDTRRIVRGLSAGDRVVVAGTLLLRAQEDRLSH